ncbi:isoaspartyl peptidase/L-asparaginase family protein [Robertkochia flava]|uniref:isoaspartyl peptidase/L-asparaginase family protein n=1 Tax=Robertkochia flava TaxID=3447986 RepID=UPI001CCE667D|nr:isoaspartyl peptidase/L-asparaginase [Robertkochia marina]
MLLIISCKQTETQPAAEQEATKPVSEKPPIGIVIHGGAGTILKENMTAEQEAAYKEKLEEAVTAGYKVLEEGGESLDAVIAAIQVMEESPLFNAGIGAVFTHEGKNELDASIMNGKDLNAGAVSGISRVKSPIQLARTVMEKSEHVMLSGTGAEAFAQEQGLEMVDPDYFYTERRMESLKRAIEREKVELDHDGQAAFYDPFIKNSKYGTVGCVALDKNGNLAAGTSTGGMTNKRYNRIGDAPIIGAGTYANNVSCAVSSTGWGEYFIRGVVAYDIAAKMEYQKIPLQQASKEVIQDKLTAMGGTGGIIAIDKSGEISMEFNTPGMYRASIDSEGQLNIGIYEK